MSLPSGRPFVRVGQMASNGSMLICHLSNFFGKKKPHNSFSLEILITFLLYKHFQIARLESGVPLPLPSEWVYVYMFFFCIRDRGYGSAPVEPHGLTIGLGDSLLPQQKICVSFIERASLNLLYYGFHIDRY